MTQVFAKQGRSLFVLLAVLAIAVAACGSSASTQAPGSSATAAPSSAASQEATSEPSSGGDGGELAGAGSAFEDINSYKFSMTILAEDITGALTALTGGDASAPMTFQGTVIVKPEPAADITIGPLHMIEVNGMQYMDLGSGTFISSPMDPGEEGMAASFSPASMFESFVDTSTEEGFHKVGTGEKNGVNADHFEADPAVTAYFGTYAGIEGATWTSDIWVATDGGYPVSFSIVGTKDSKVVYQISFDVMNVNDPNNKVEAPKVSL
jgi:hypothetical protein